MTKRERARVSRAMATVMRVAGNKEGKGGKGDGDSNNGGGQVTATAMQRAMATVTRVADEQWQRPQRGQWQWQQG